MIRVEVERPLIVYQRLAVVPQLTVGKPHEVVGVVVPGAALYDFGHIVHHSLPISPLECFPGSRLVGKGTVPAALYQRRSAYEGGERLLTAFTRRTTLPPVEARTLLAKFNLGSEHVQRACATLSPGERTRAQLAELMARGVNCLVLDEPTNHLDLEAIEQLETALQAYDGTVVVVSHDRRFLENVAPTRSISL